MLRLRVSCLGMSATGLMAAAVFTVMLSCAGTAVAEDAVARGFPALDPAMVPGTEAAIALERADLSQPVFFEAEDVRYDERSEVVIAAGRVEMLQDGQTLTADEVAYDIGADQVMARGNVVLVGRNGDVHHADAVKLTGKMQEGAIQGLLSKLPDGSRFTASEGLRQEGVRTVMRDASYTPCEVCEENPEPLWQIKASRVTHDEQEKTVHYKNARMEFAGVPILYTPVFMHPDPQVKRKSGFLRPEYGWASDTGGYFEAAYYFADIVPNMDATLRVRPTMKRGVLTQGEWRQRMESGQFNINAGGVVSDRDEENGRVSPDQTRGHLAVEGVFDISNAWRMGFDTTLVSDKSYFRLYDLDNEDILQNRLYLERFSGRDYTNIRAVAFRDLRLGVRPEQPAMTPELTHRMYGRPQGLFGGRWEAGVSSLFLYRSGGTTQDVQRASVDLGWERRFVADSGIVTTLRTSGQVDGYRVRENAAAPPGTDKNTDDVRAHGVVNMVTSYPLKKHFSSLSWLVEPMFGAAFSPKAQNKNGLIPNEDSLEVMIDTRNLFSDNRFPGIDRRDDGTRISYGLKTGLYGHYGRYASLFLGQSRRFDRSNLYPVGSGLEDKQSAYVGQVQVGLNEAMQTAYRFQLDPGNFSSQRHELMIQGRAGPLSTTGRYLYINGVQGTDFVDAREQAELGLVYQMTDTWSAYGKGLYDLAQEPGLRTGMVGLGYTDQCFSFAVEGVRNLTNDAAGRSETVITARIGFKNLGEFSGPSIAVRENAE